MNMQEGYELGTSFWGPSTWRTIHAIAATYKPNKKNAQAFKDFINSLTYLLPCPVCRIHLQQNIASLPLERYLVSQEKLFEWTYLLHDRVNGQLGKNSPTYREVRKLYYDALKGVYKD